MSVTRKKVVFFTADTLPTSAELLEIARLDDLAASPYKIQVRNGGGTEKMESIETCDYVAGTVPTAYAAKTLFGTDGKIHADRPLAFAVFPPTVSVSHSSGTAQARAIQCDGTNAEDATLTDLSTTVAWTSSDETKATVGASTGLITGVGAGSCTVTATYTYASGKTLTDTVAVTVT